MSGNTHLLDQSAEKVNLGEVFEFLCRSVQDWSTIHPTGAGIIDKNFDRAELSTDGIEAGVDLLLDAQVGDVVICCARKY